MRTIIVLVVNLLLVRAESMALMLTSSAFQPNHPVPKEYTCNGANVSPPLEWSGVPEETRAFVLICEDPDVPLALRADGMYDHWVLFNIPVSVTGLPKNIKTLPEGTIQGKNTSQKLGYTGPCPPDRQHRYFFRLFALDTPLPLPEGATKAEVLAACQGHILDQAELVGVYEQPHS